MPQRRLLVVATGAVLLGASLAYSSAAHSRATHRGAPRVAGSSVKYVPSNVLTLPDTLGGSVTAKELSGAIAADAAGDVYVGVCGSDFRHHVVVFGGDGRYVRDFRAGNCGTGEAVRIAAGPDGLLYATRIGPSDEIGVFNSQGSQVRLIGGIGRLNTITARDIDLDGAGNIYVAIRHDSSTGGSDNDEVVRLTQAGQVTGRWVPLPPPYPCNGQCVKGVAAAPDGTVWVTTNDPKRELVHLDANGTVLADAPHLDVIFHDLGTHGRDIDFANGRLYIAGSTGELAVVSSEGKLIDSISHLRGVTGNYDRQVAVRGEDVYLVGVDLAGATHVAGAAAACASCAIGHLAGKPVAEPGPEESEAWTDCAEGQSTAQNRPGSPATINLWRGNPCNDRIGFTNNLRGSPCPVGSSPEAGRAFLGGQQVGRLDEQQSLIPGERTYVLTIPPDQLAGGSVVAEFNCFPDNGDKEFQVYEHKGDIVLHDPSGNVLDGKTGRPVDAATVTLQFSPQKNGAFGIPGPSGISPQLNPQLTGPDGFFGWDVADGVWRLRVTAFGYRAFTSPAYTVPPAITGLRLKLRQDPVQQARLVDVYIGRVGSVVVGRATGARPSGLKLHVVRGKVRGIVVGSRRYRTARGIMVGSRLLDVLAAYPRDPSTASAKAIRAGTYKVGRATFKFRRGRVSGIAFGR